MNKRGASPLLVTIVLIAFAVAIGTMIMNWSSDVVAGSTNPCEGVDLKIQEAFNEKLVCYDTNYSLLKVILSNKGVDIEGLRMRTILPNFETKETVLSNSKISSGEFFDNLVPYELNQKNHIELIPEVQNGDSKKLCPDKTITITELPFCDELENI